MDAATQHCHIGLLAAGASSPAKGKRGCVNIKSIGIGTSKSNWPNSSSQRSTTNASPLIRSVPPLSSSLSAAAPPEAHEGQSKTAQVKFVLQRACMFGERFFIVGDDPMLGLWDPECAVPLEWSDGHLWTVAMDIPVGRCIQFKFLLRGLSGEVQWQPGPDRVIRIWDTQNTIVVAEDWEHADSQKITEEQAAASLIDAGDPEGEDAEETNVDVLLGDDSPRSLDSGREANQMLVSAKF